jgi:hypothetical protein
MNHEGAPGSERSERAADEQNAAGGEDSHHLRACVGGIRKRTDEIEDGAEAKRAAERSKGFHGRVIDRREEEDEACLAETFDGHLRREFDGNAESFENIGGAAARGDGAVAMFGDSGSGSGGNECGSAGNVEGLRPTAASADAVDEIVPLIRSKG